MRVADKGSRQQYADVQLQGVTARGIIDSGSDITIMGGELFRKVAAVARLQKSQFRRPDKTLGPMIEEYSLWMGKSNLASVSVK